MAAQAANLAALAAFDAVLERIGFTQPQRDAIIETTGCRNVAMLGLLAADQISKMCKRLESRTVNPIVITTVQEQLLLGLRFWVSNNQRLQLPIVAEEFTMIIALNQVQKMRQHAEDDARMDKEIIAKAPDKFKTGTTWKIFAEATETYLGQLLGSGRIPLSYIIRRTELPDPEAIYQNDLERLIAIAPLVGDAFQRDNARVYGIIKQLVIEGPGRSYILPYDRANNGRQAWLALRTHYEGEGFKNRNVEEAYSTLEHIFYEGEKKGFTFEKFLERHNECYLELERHGEPVIESKKIRDFLGKIKAPELQAAVQAVRASAHLLTNFQEAANFIALSVKPIVKPNQRLIGAVETGNPGRGRGRQDGRHYGRNPGRGDGRGDGRGRYQYTPGRGRGRTRGRGRGFRPPGPAGRGNIHTGYYDDAEWQSLSLDQRTQVLEARGTKRNVSTVTINNSQRNDDLMSAITDVPASVATGNSNAVSSSNTLGGNAGTQFGRRRIAVVTSGIRHKRTGPVISSIWTEQREQEQEQYGFLELDTHADTSCVGTDCRIISITEDVCQVHPYHPGYDAIDEVPIVQAATAYDDAETGITYMLIINQALQVPNLQTTLLNPNQMRMNGIIVDDIPKHLAPNPAIATHSIYVPNADLRIPLKLKGIISGIKTRYPSVHEVENCPWIELTSSEPWDPKSDDFEEQEKEMEKRCSSSEHEITPDRYIYAIKTNDVCLQENMNNDTMLDEMINMVQISSISSTKGGAELRNKIARTFNIGLETADRTLKASTQLALRHTLHPIHRRYRTQVAQLRYPRLSGRHGRFHTDTFFASTPSIHNSTMGQMYTNDIHFSKFYPMKTKAEAPNTLISFMQDIGIPSELHSDDAKELTMGRMKDIAREFWIKTTQSEPYSPWQVRAELAIREVKKSVRDTMITTKAPKRLWDYCTTYQCELRNLIAHPLFQLQGRTPYEVVTGRTPDISEYLDYKWYDTIWYYDHDVPFPQDRRKLGKWLGVAHRVGQALCYYILTDTARPIVRSSVQPLTRSELSNENIKGDIRDLNQKIIDHIGEVELPDLPVELQDDYDIYEPMEPEASKPEIGDYTPEAYDALIAAELMLPKGDILTPAKVVARKRDADGNPIGIANQNPILDTRIYEVQFPDGHTESYAANIIVENMYAQVDHEGNQFLLLDEIIDHRSDEHAVQINAKYVDTPSGQRLKKTTDGWYLKVQWKEGTTSWETLRDLKESNPIEVAEYAVAHNLCEEPAFAWWVPFTLKKRNKIVASIKTRAKHRKKDYKFGIELPRTIKRALEIDKETGTTFWADAIAKEMKHVRPAFNILEENAKAPPGSKFIRCHMNFEIKMDFTRKARFVAGGHMTDPPTSLTYSSVVARDSVRLAFLIAAMNDLDLLAADIGNAYLNAYTKEKVHTECGLEFGHEFVGRTAIIVRALYGLKSSGAAWRSLFASTLSDLEFTSCLADPDVWMREAVKPTGEEYYEYIFVYVDDLLVLSHDPSTIMNTISDSYRLKNDSVQKPTTYLGAQIKEFRHPENPMTSMWSISADQYIKDALHNLEFNLQRMEKRLPTKVTTPLSSNYRPELDMTPYLDDDFTRFYQQLIGILRWSVELGRIDIHLPVALLAQHLAQPRVGHLDQVFHIFAYLKQHSRSRIVMDPTKPMVDQEQFVKMDWNAFYPDAKEQIPPNAPRPRGNSILISCFVDADHAGNQVTRRSHTGIIIFCNRAPIIWFSKRQNTIETSTFGSEFIAARIAVELIEGLRYKLRMFGIPIDGPTNMYCDNGSVVVNCTKPESTLKKKHNSIAYHKVRESVAQGTIRIAKENGDTNLADVLTKPLAGPRLKELIQYILY